ncbi:MAG: geranylgeranylglycerol-phosphate geranylgeranyltransferase [Bacillota bacterium]
MLKGFYRLSRPINALAGIIAVLLSGYVAKAPSWWPVIMAAITVFLITVSTNAWNDYIDIEIDRVNKPQRPLPSGQISPRGALVFSIAGSAISLLVAAFINQPAFLIALGSNILLYLYSWKLKCTVLFGNAAVATVIALCFIFGGVAAGNIQPVLLLAVTVFFAMMGREILKTMADYKGDLQQKCGTISTVWGKKIARVFVVIFLGITAIIMLAVYFVEQYSFVYLLIIVFGVYPLFSYVAINAKSTYPGKKLEKMSTIIKYVYFIWFLAVALGAGLAA